MPGRRNVTLKVARRSRKRQHELDAKREERQTAPPKASVVPSKYRAKKAARTGQVERQHPRRHLRRLERENYVPTVGAAD